MQNVFGDIREIFLGYLNECSKFVVDVTGKNPNVMYEIGQAHARGINPLLICRKRIEPSTYLPFYLRRQSVEIADAETKSGRSFLKERIGIYLNAK